MDGKGIELYVPDQHDVGSHALKPLYLNYVPKVDGSFAWLKSCRCM